MDAVRRQIDAIDDAIHDLLLERTKVVRKIGSVKGGHGANLRPGREAAVLRRLVRRHTGAFPKPVLVRIWREIFAAHVALQGPFSVAVCGHDVEAGYWDLARDQYGSHTPMARHQSASRVIDTVARGEAAVGVLPMPGDDDPWWPHLMSADAAAPRIIARLPFAGPASGRGRDLEALVIGRLTAEPTESDRTFVAIDAAQEIALARLTAALADAGLTTTFAAEWHDDQTPGAWLHLAEVEGFAAPDDRRLARFVDAADGLVKGTMILGSYAVPLAPEELAPAPARRRRS